MIRERVNQVLADWCGEQPVDQETSVETLWVTTRNHPSRPHNGIEFQPVAVEDLLSKLASEFSKPGDERKNISVLKPKGFKPLGDIETVNHLIAAVVGCPNLPATGV